MVNVNSFYSYRFNWDSWDFISENEKWVKEKLLDFFQIIKVQRQYIVEDWLNNILYFSPIINEWFSWKVSLYSSKKVLITEGKTEFNKEDLKKYFKNVKNFKLNNKILLFWILNWKPCVVNCSEWNSNAVNDFLLKRSNTELFPYCSLIWEEKSTYNWKKYFGLKLDSDNSWNMLLKKEELKEIYKNILDYIENKNNFIESLNLENNKIIIDFNKKVESFIFEDDRVKEDIIENDEEIDIAVTEWLYN